MKYYHSENAGQPKAGILFTVYDIVAGSACGVYATDKPEEIAKLDELSASDKSPVREIDQAEYDDCIKKNPPGLKTWSPFSVELPRLQPQPLKGKGAVVVESREAPKAEPVIEIKEQVETADEALQTGAIRPSEGTNEPTPEATDGRTAHRRGRKNP